MRAAHVFRALLIAQFLLPILSTVVRATSASPRPPAAHFGHLSSAVALLVIAAEIAATIGLWGFRAWARIGAVILLLVALAFAFFQFHSAFVSRGSFALIYLEQFITGVLFAMMFLPPLALEFSRRKV
jgi:hypothetical protein